MYRLRVTASRIGAPHLQQRVSSKLLSRLFQCDRANAGEARHLENGSR